MYAKQMELNKRNRTNRALASAYLTVTPLKGLSWKTLVSYDYTGNSDNNFSGGIKRVNYYNGTAIDVTKGTNAYVNPSNDNDYSFGLGNNDGQTLSIQNTLTYSWKNDVHDLTVMLGNEVSRYYGQWTSASSRGFWSPDNRNVGLTTKPETLSGSGALNLESRGISYFGRASYSLLNRYILTATLRRDGSSNFGAGNRWGTFPSAALAWRVSEEAFMQNQDVVSNLKLRLGWGQLRRIGRHQPEMGNQRADEHRYRCQLPAGRLEPDNGLLHPQVQGFAALPPDTSFYRFLTSLHQLRRNREQRF